MTAADYAAALREVADFYDTHPDVPAPYDCSIGVGSFDDEDEGDVVKRLARTIAPLKKDWAADGAAIFTLVKRLPHAEIRFIFYRASVCERRVVGVEEVPERVVPAHTRELVEWDCHPLLRDGA